MANPMDQIGPQPIDISPDAQNAWMLRVIAAFNSWSEQYLAALAALGFTVSLIDDMRGVVTQVYQVPPYLIISMSKYGHSVERVVSMQVAYGRAPADQAQADATNIWAHSYAMASGVNPLNPSTGQYTPAPAPAPAPTVTPGPAPTVVTQTAINQAPPTPDVGTSVGATPAQAPGRPSDNFERAALSWLRGEIERIVTAYPELAYDQHTIDEFNWFYEQVSGRKGQYPADWPDRDRRVSISVWAEHALILQYETPGASAPMSGGAPAPGPDAGALSGADAGGFSLLANLWAWLRSLVGA